MVDESSRTFPGDALPELFPLVSKIVSPVEVFLSRMYFNREHNTIFCIHTYYVSPISGRKQADD